MKLPLLILSGSLALNVALLALTAFSRGSGPPITEKSFAPTSNSTPPTSLLHPNSQSAARAAEPASATSLAEIATRLRMAGLPAKAIRAAIEAELNVQFLARETALLPPKKNLSHWWQAESTALPVETRLAQVALRREKSRLRFELLGPDPDAPAHDSMLSPAKREQAQMLTSDYADIAAAMRQTGTSLRLLTAAEREALQFFEAEKKRELAALLTPDEAAEWEFRTSPAIAEIRRRVHGFDDASPEELRALSDYYQKEAAALKTGLSLAKEKEFDVAAEAALGAERFADFKRSRDFEFNTLRKLVLRLELPPETAVEVFALRDRLERESARHAGLAGDLAAMKNLASEVRQSIQAKLGPVGSAAYLTRAEAWLGVVERGQAIEFTNNGWGSR
ncbi:MAG: hypothetical protein ABIO94_13800 [Opitutaceae bacterium]